MKTIFLWALLGCALATTGCTSGLAQLCSIEGDCEKWSDTQFSNCEASAETLDDQVQSKGCESQADALLQCAENAGCNTQSCAAEEQALKSCGVDI